MNAYMEGYESYWYYEENPYPYDTPEHDEWEDGYEDAMFDDYDEEDAEFDGRL